MNRLAPLGLLGLAACSLPPPAHPLPNALSAVVELEEGGYASLMVELRGDEGAPAVRAAGGVLAVTEDAVLSLDEISAEGGARVLRLADLLTGRRVDLPLEGDFELLKLAPEGEAVVQVGGRILTLSLPAGQVVAGGSRSPQGLFAPGPRAGFHLRQQEGRLELLCPRGDDQRWWRLVDGVASLEGASWLRVAALPALSAALIESRLKEVDAVRVEAGAAEADGDLAEWRGVEAHRVEREGQVLSGRASWDGPRDASFGVSARRVGDALVVAVRVRDDARVAGDTLELLLAGREVRLPLVADAPVSAGPGWEAHLGEPSWQGLPLEIAVALPRGVDLDDDPLVVQLVDADPGEVSTRLGSAPDPMLAGLAALTDRHR